MQTVFSEFSAPSSNILVMSMSAPPSLPRFFFQHFSGQFFCWPPKRKKEKHHQSTRSVQQFGDINPPLIKNAHHIFCLEVFLGKKRPTKCQSPRKNQHTLGAYPRHPLNHPQMIQEFPNINCCLGAFLVCSRAIILPTQTMHNYVREIPQNYHTIASSLDPPKWVPFNDPYMFLCGYVGKILANLILSRFFACQKSHEFAHAISMEPRFATPPAIFSRRSRAYRSWVICLYIPGSYVYPETCCGKATKYMNIRKKTQTQNITSKLSPSHDPKTN